MPQKSGAHHAVPNSGDEWNVKKDAATHRSGHFDKKQDAVDAGRYFPGDTTLRYSFHPPRS